MKFKYLSLENFLTLVRKAPRVLKRMKRKWFLTMMIHIFSPPNLRKRTPSLTVLASPSTATDMKSTVPPFFSMKRRTWCIIQILHNFGTTWRLETVHWQQQAIAEMCSAAQRKPVCLCTPRSLDYAEGEVWSGEVPAGENSFDQYEWDICVDLKMVNFQLGQQSWFI